MKASAHDQTSSLHAAPFHRHADCPARRLVLPPVRMHQHRLHPSAGDAGYSKFTLRKFRIESPSLRLRRRLATRVGRQQLRRESGNTGVLQLNNKSIAAAGYTPQQYGSLPLQQQVNIWAQQVGNGNTSGAYGTLTNSLGSSINGVPITQGTLAACFQFGPVICKNDLATIQANGSCPAKGSGCTASPAGANRGNGTFCGASSAQLDDNGLSICTYAPKIQKQMSAANSSCDGASTTPSNTPTTNCPGTGTNPGGAISPSPGNAPVTLPANLA